MSWTLLHDAIRPSGFRGNSVIVRLLEVKADVNAMDSTGRIPLHHAAFYGDSALVRILLEGKADVNAVDSKDMTPLHRAVSGGDDAVVSVLLEGKADVNAMDSSNLTPLDTAVEMGDVVVVRVLVEGKADVNAQADWSKSTPLYLAANLAETPCVRVLVEGKANVNAINARGETALFGLLLQSQDYLMHGQISTTTVFLEQSVDLSLKDKYGTTIGEAIKRPVWHIPPEVQQSPGWQFIQEHALGQSNSRKLFTL